MTPQLRFALAPGAVLPTRGHSEDAGVDLATLGGHSIPGGGFLDIPTGVYCQIPHGCWARLEGRSSTLRRYGLLVNPGVIDRGYTGELFVGIQNLTDEAVEIHDGQRLAQLIVQPMWNQGRFEIAQVESLVAGERGEAGFGSTGR